MGVGAGVGATQGVLGNTGTSSDGERRGVADGGAHVPEVLPAAELEIFVARVGSEHLEPTEGASVSEYVEESQVFAVDATRGAHHAGQKGIGNTRPRGVK